MCLFYILNSLISIFVSYSFREVISDHPLSKMHTPCLFVVVRLNQLMEAKINKGVDHEKWRADPEIRPSVASVSSNIDVLTCNFGGIHQRRTQQLMSYIFSIEEGLFRCYLHFNTTVKMHRQCQLP